MFIGYLLWIIYYSEHFICFTPFSQQPKLHETEAIREGIKHKVMQLISSSDSKVNILNYCILYYFWSHAFIISWQAVYPYCLF